MFEDLSLSGLLQKGGITVVVLLFLSVISIAIMLERSWAFRRFRKELASFFPALKKAVDESGLSAASGMCGISASPLAPVFLSGLKKLGKKREEVIDAMELAGRMEIAKLERYLGVLGTIGSTAPFIGLFGTVLGIIRAFSDLALAEGASPSAVADGIAEALIATAAGLFVAIPAVMAYNFFVRSSSRCALDLEARASEFVDPISSGEKNGLEAQ